MNAIEVNMNRVTADLNKVVTTRGPVSAEERDSSFVWIQSMITFAMAVLIRPAPTGNIFRGRIHAVLRSVLRLATTENDLTPAQVDAVRDHLHEVVATSRAKMDDGSRQVTLAELMESRPESVPFAADAPVTESEYVFDPSKLSPEIILSMSMWLMNDYNPKNLDVAGVMCLSELLLKEGSRRGWQDGWVDDPSLVSLGLGEVRLPADASGSGG